MANKGLSLSFLLEAGNDYLVQHKADIRSKLICTWQFHDCRCMLFCSRRLKNQLFALHRIAERVVGDGFEHSAAFGLNRGKLHL